MAVIRLNIISTKKREEEEEEEEEEKKKKRRREKKREEERRNGARRALASAEVKERERERFLRKIFLIFFSSTSLFIPSDMGVAPF